jgi:hypothetical protein
VRRFWSAAGAAAALLFVVFVASSALLPAFAWRADALVSMALGVTLLGLMVAGLLPLRHLGSRALLVAAVGLIVAIVGSALGVVALADLGKIAFGAGVGLWLGATLATLTGDVRVIVGLAVGVALLDAASVFVSVGPTRLLLTRAPSAISYFVVAFPTIGYSIRDAYSALGTSDVIFFGLYLAVAAAYGLRVRLTLLFMGASIVATVALALYSQALPALPLLSAAFLAVNADLIVRRWNLPTGVPTERGPEL